MSIKIDCSGLVLAKHFRVSISDNREHLRFKSITSISFRFCLFLLLSMGMLQADQPKSKVKISFQKIKKVKQGEKNLIHVKVKALEDVTDVEIDISIPSRISLHQGTKRKNNLNSTLKCNSMTGCRKSGAAVGFVHFSQLNKRCTNETLQPAHAGTKVRNIFVA